ncbi:redoxin domain-containing protein [Candidatus Poribacteria bacterium]|nr:redoxin domain-containing protein [Candidatus Poribacteria bacterium]MYB63183.1 redoxin domain-containing protein [Candidatus Poribacteria bacterium]
MLHLRRKTNTLSKVMNIVILVSALMFGFCIGLTADDSAETQPVPKLTPAQIGFKYQEIKVLGKELATENKSEELELLVQKATDFVRLFPKYKRVDEVYYYLGNALVRLDRVQEGITVFEKLYKELPDARYVAPGLLELGLAYDKLSQHDKADTAFNKLIEHKKYGTRSQAKIAQKILEQDRSERKGQLPNQAQPSLGNPKADLVGKPAPVFKVKDLKGKELSLEKYRGQVVLLDFWATWCGPCIAELPNVQKTYQKYKDKKFQIIGISLDRSITALDTFLKKNELPWVHYWDDEGKISNQYRVTAIPSMFLIDGKGVIHTTNLRGAKLEKAVDALVKENLLNPTDPNAKPKTIPATKMIKMKPAIPEENAPKTEEIKLEDLVGKPVPDFTVKDLNGKEISIKDLKGQVVLIDFWATWCGPCIKEMPKVKNTYAKFKDQKFAIIGISLDRSVDPLKTYIAKEELSWKQYWDQDRTVRNLFGVKFIPTAVIIDGEGIVRKAKVGGFNLETAVETYVKENLAKNPIEPSADEN